MKFCGLEFSEIVDGNIKKELNINREIGNVILFNSMQFATELKIKKF